MYLQFIVLIFAVFNFIDITFGTSTGTSVRPLVNGTRNSSIVPTLKIVTVIEPPFVFKNLSCMALLEGSGNESSCYSGFCIDLINRMGEELRFNWTIYDVKEYGEYSNATGQWSGMVQEILENRADIALGALKITTERSKVIGLVREPYKVSAKGSYAIGFNNKLSYNLMRGLTDATRKLFNQRYLELLTDVWWVENRTKDGVYFSPN